MLETARVSEVKRLGTESKEEQRTQSMGILELMQHLHRTIYTRFDRKRIPDAQEKSKKTNIRP